MKDRGPQPPPTLPPPPSPCWLSPNWEKRLPPRGGKAPGGDHAGPGSFRVARGDLEAGEGPDSALTQTRRPLLQMEGVTLERRISKIGASLSPTILTPASPQWETDSVQPETYLRKLNHNYEATLEEGSVPARDCETQAPFPSREICPR